MLLSAGTPVAAQHGSDAGLTDSIQRDRLVVLQVDPAAGRLYCLEAGARVRVVEFTKDALPLIVTDGVRRADLSLLIAGDLIKIQRGADGQAHTIVVLRHTSDEIGSPE
jgi:hypothetical protein